MACLMSEGWQMRLLARQPKEQTLLLFPHGLLCIPGNSRLSQGNIVILP